MIWVVTIAFLAALLAFALIIVRLNDRLQQRKSQTMIATHLSSMPHDIEALEAFFGRRLPEGLRSWREPPEAFEQPVQLPNPNADLFITELLPLNPSALSLLGWKRTLPYVPIAALRDGDLIVVGMDSDTEGGAPVHAYFHDGGEFELVYDDISQLRQIIRAARQGRAQR